MEKGSNDTFRKIYHRSTLNIIIFASAVIITSIIITAITGYNTSKNAVVQKLKTNDLQFMITSISAQIDGRIEKAKETSILIADDPAIQAWFKSNETDPLYKEMVINRITNFSANFDYSNIFMANDLTKNFWNNGHLVDTMTRDDEDDNWYFNTIASKQKVNLNIDYNRELHDTFLWVNTLMGEIDRPIGIAGVGVSLGDYAREFQAYKIGENSNLWLIDSNGVIGLSEDVVHMGMNIENYIPGNLKQEMLASVNQYLREPIVREYKSNDGKVMDLIYQPLQSCEWLLVFQVPRHDVVAILDTIRVNTIVTIFITVFAIIFIFFLVSRKIANPYKKALLVNEELERLVEIRTNELTEKNTKLTDSIEYAKRIQESILPTPVELEEIFKEYFVIWKPLDTVGGDFYWAKKTDDGCVVVVADCTGHGVPGAFMTMAVNSILNHIVTSMNTYDPTIILKQLDQALKQHLNKEQNNHHTDDGLEAGVCYIRNHHSITFAGGGIDLYVKNSAGINVVKGTNRGIGYRKTNLEKLTNHVMVIDSDSTLYMTTDGFLDQNGGYKDVPLGRRRFTQILSGFSDNSLTSQGKGLLKELEMYMGEEPQRDDITILGFQVI